MGNDTYKVPFTMYHQHRQKLIKAFSQKLPKGENLGGKWIILQAGKQLTRNWTDHEPLFRQESYFSYLFGVREPDCYAGIEIGGETGQSVLFIPRLPVDYAVWMGKIRPCGHFKERYGVDHVYYVDEMAKVLVEKGAKTLYLLKGFNSDSKETHQPAELNAAAGFPEGGPLALSLTVDVDFLHPILSECRVIKTPEEIALLRYINKVSSRAHVEVMRRCRVGMREYEMESIFLHEVYSKGGCRNVSYTCICGVGHHGATLHYGHAAAPNDGEVKDGDMALLDMGGEYHCYASDITCSYPVNGKFTEKQKGIYNAVLRAQQEVMKAMKPGVAWPDMHRLAERVIVEDLLKLGLLKGTVEENQKAYIGAIFMPHGLGHFMGLDTHDVGGYPAGVNRIDEPGIRSLRTARHLEAGMVITVEPGIYFIDYVLEKACQDPVQSKYLNKELIDQYKGFGGIRLEDNVVITENGIENLTKCPRTVEEVEAVMRGGPWVIA